MGVEKSILQKRLVKLSNSDRNLIINCTECWQRLADLKCMGCDGDFFCFECNDKLHSKVKHLKVNLKDFSINNTIAERRFIKNNSFVEKEDRDKAMNNW